MEVIREFWTYILTGVALVVWAVRIESKTEQNASEIRRVWKQRAEDLAAHREAREATNALLNEVRNDIKTLLGRARD